MGTLDGLMESWILGGFCQSWSVLIFYLWDCNLEAQIGNVELVDHSCNLEGLLGHSYRYKEDIFDRSQVEEMGA